ncbi:helix-turn-helix domain-containing protein [Brevundimonas balnearis]|uniref:Helix-turn-helix domain-containing protein n=1 Tax=Brevundimonas balnearis TaxID=1572858 RepID=A0ABV6R7U1_9CAUL
MTDAPFAIDPVMLGERLRLARDAAKVTQAQAAVAIGAARTTLVAIEQGGRRPRVDELQTLAALYGTTLNALLRRESARVDLRPRFRRGQNTDGLVEPAAALLTDLVKSEIELEDLLGIVRVRNEPPERPLLPGNVLAQAEEDAFELRQWLGIGDAPIHDVVSILELQLGARVFVRRLESKIAGLYAYDGATGPCILLNAAHPRERRAQTAAHELGHYISTRRAPDSLYEGPPEQTREERYANAFARAFLTPARTLKVMFRDVTAGAAKLTRRHVIVLAHAFGVSREALVRRLEDIQLVPSGTWDWFDRTGGITNEQAYQVLGHGPEFDPRGRDAERPVSLRLHLLAAEAWKRGLLSEGQVASLLKIDRVHARELIDAYDADEEVGDGLPRLQH